jgi:hypothetical protein
MLAVGFAESYIRLWSLKGEQLKGMRSDFSASAVRDRESCRCQMLPDIIITSFRSVVAKSKREERQYDAQIDWPQWACVFR